MDKPIDLNDRPVPTNRRHISFDEALSHDTLPELRRMAQKKLDAITDAAHVAHTAALNNLADAIRELAAAIRAHLEPPAKINLAEDAQADTYVDRNADGQG